MPNLEVGHNLILEGVSNVRVFRAEGFAPLLNILVILEPIMRIIPDLLDVL